MSVSNSVNRAFTFLVVIAVALPGYSKVHESPTQTQNRTDTLIAKNNSESQRAPVVTKAILLEQNDEGQIVPVCAIDTTKRTDLVPAFANKAPENFQSSIQLDLRNCDQNEVDAIAYQASLAIEQDQAQVAAVPVIMLSFCSGLVLAASYVNSNRVRQNEEIDLGGQITYGTISLASYNAMMNMSKGLAATASAASHGFTLGFVCSGLGSVIGYYGTKYLME